MALYYENCSCLVVNLSLSFHNKTNFDRVKSANYFSHLTFENPVLNLIKVSYLLTHLKSYLYECLQRIIEVESILFGGFKEIRLFGCGPNLQDWKMPTSTLRPRWPPYPNPEGGGPPSDDLVSKAQAGGDFF